MSHSPVLVSEYNGTRYAICEYCDSNIESWFFDQEEDRLAHWSPYGIFITAPNGKSGWLQKRCDNAPAVKTVKRKLVSL